MAHSYCVDKTAERVGKAIAIIGGIAPSQVKPQQDGEQPKRDDDKADERNPDP